MTGVLVVVILPPRVEMGPRGCLLVTRPRLPPVITIYTQNQQAAVPSQFAMHSVETETSRVYKPRTYSRMITTLYIWFVEMDSMGSK